MGVLCATAENSGLLKKKERKKDKRTAVKLKAVPTTSGCLKIRAAHGGPPEPRGA